MGQYYKPALKGKNQKVWRTFNTWDFNNGAKLMEHSYISNSVTMYVKKLIFNNPTKLVWAGDYAENEKGKDENIYVLGKEQKPNYIPTQLPDKYYLVNHTKHAFVDYSKIKANKYGYRIDPMPILCADGNGQGGGDYYGNNMQLVGTWARDLISIEETIPNGYNEIVPAFKEGDFDE